MAEVNRWLIDGPPRTFREACQWIAWFNMAALTTATAADSSTYCCGRTTSTSGRGRIDEETAVFILACLLLNDTRYYQSAGGPAPGDQRIACRS